MEQSETNPSGVTKKASRKMTGFFSWWLFVFSWCFFVESS